jgi:glycosidase
MKNLYCFFIFILLSNLGFSQVSWQGGVTPESNQSATILFDKTGTGLATYNGTIYAHTGVTLNGTAWSNVIGNWGNNLVQPSLTLVSGNIYKLVLTPTILAYYGVTTGVVSKINMVFRSDTGTAQTVDLEINVGAFQSTLVQPNVNSTTIINSGGSLSISANNTGGNANYNLKANGVSINSISNATTYSFTDTNITTNQNYELVISLGGATQSKFFNVMVNPITVNQALPSNTLVDGINYNSDTSKATLVLDAPGKDFVYVAGSFNNYQPSVNDAMKKDPTTGKFWLELTGLTPGVNYNYQYWVVDTTPIAGSPALVKTADPYSTLVLSPFDDPYIPASNYPNIPAYPAGQEREVTVLKTGETPYNWQVTNFNKPKKEDLIVYEVLIRDFDQTRSFQGLINRIDYFKNLKVNAIQLMPVMEFEGNESWGYNTSYHMALDKFYGPKEKMKEFVDLCHQNGIAVILDIALNHAFGRNAMNRMWMNDPDGDGWGSPASDSPYFNMVATHSYSVGSDFNHQQSRTQNYTRRVVKQWIEEFKIDGFRWDLTKGFTQNATGSEANTNAYQQDRVDVLKNYADYTWSLDPTHYAIFEHLGSDNEEKEWANYRLSETPSKGVMMWSEMTYAYAQLASGYATGADIYRIGSDAHSGFLGKRVMGYPESHDKERLLYTAMTTGNGAGAAPPFGNLNNALGRMSAIGATSLLIPGPKMIWHFADLGMQMSIYDCNNGTVNTESDPTPGDCKLNTKPQPQWVGNWLGVTERAKIYNDWSKMIALKVSEPVFEGSYSISPDGNNVKQRIYIFDNALPSTQLKNVVVLANFSVANLTIVPSFPYAGTWYNLMDNTSITVTDVNAPISINAGQFFVYGNKLSTLGNNEIEAAKVITLSPNPTSNNFTLSANTTKVEIYSITGQLVKSFKSNFSTESQFEISDLNNGIYLVKVTDTNDRESTLKLVKQ